jgi:hypothetical protein
VGSNAVNVGNTLAGATANRDRWLLIAKAHDLISGNIPARLKA